MDPIQRYWARCRARLPREPLGERYTVRQIGNTPELCDTILDLIVSGAKTGTYSLPDELAAAGKLPRVGDYVIVQRFDATPGCLVRMDHCQTLPFNAIGPAELAAEGPGARDPATWRALHEAYWRPKLAARGARFAADMPVLFQRFTLLDVASRADYS